MTKVVTYSFTCANSKSIVRRSLVVRIIPFSQPTIFLCFSLSLGPKVLRVKILRKIPKNKNDRIYNSLLSLDCLQIQINLSVIIGSIDLNSSTHCFIIIFAHHDPFCREFKLRNIKFKAKIFILLF